MMGQQSQKESLFYYFRLEDQIPETHLLRLIDRSVDFSFVRDRLTRFYSPTGRPSIDPEVLLRLLLVGYLYGITSERRLLDEVRMHLAYRWFTRLGFDQALPDHSSNTRLPAALTSGPGRLLVGRQPRPKGAAPLHRPRGIEDLSGMRVSLPRSAPCGDMDIRSNSHVVRIFPL